MKPLLLIILNILTLSGVAQFQPIKSGVYHWNDLPVRVGTNRETRRIMEGTSPHLEYLEIHATTQMPGAAPRPAHDNKDTEELIIVKEGKLKVTLDDHTAVLGTGGVALILPQVMQSVENIGNGPVTYYVIRYRSKKPMHLERGKVGGGSLILNQDSLEFVPSSKGGSRAYFNRPTSMFENFEMHMTFLNKKGPSHSPHSHIDTEMMLVLDGYNEVTIGEDVFHGNPGDLYFINSETMHTGGNGSDAPCLYFAFKWR